MIGTIVGVIGVFLTLLFGVYSIKTSKRDQKSHGIIFSKVQCLSLFDSIVENIDGVEVNYRNSPISKSIILFEGRVHNNGLKDIDKASIHSPLNIVLDERFSLLECKVSSASEKIKAIAKIKQKNKIEINWDLLKKNEFIQFSTLVKEIEANHSNTDEGEDLIEFFYNSIDFDFRITNIDSIEKEPFAPKEVERKKERIKKGWFLSGVITVFGLMLFLTGVFKPSILYKDAVGWKVVNKTTNQEQEKEIRNFLEEDKVIIVDQISGKKDRVPIDSFLNIYKITDTTIIGGDKNSSYKFMRYFNLIFGGLYFIAGLFFVYRNYKRYKEFKNTPNNG